MKNYLFIFLICGLFFVSCKGHPHTPRVKPSFQVPGPPAEPCENVSWSAFPANTDGYQSHRFDTITVQTYVKNSHFDSLIKTFKVLNTSHYRDDPKYRRGFSFPDEITSEFDLLITIEKKDHYKITEVKTKWIPRYCQSFCGYECTITTFLVNGQREGGNLSLKNPDFKFPDESLENLRKRTELKASSNYTKDGWTEL
nr:hypothetical protein [uncultured Fluviicola sp.]